MDLNPAAEISNSIKGRWTGERVCAEPGEHHARSAVTVTEAPLSDEDDTVSRIFARLSCGLHQRQRAAFSGVILIRWAICWFSRPSAASSTIRARSTRRAGMERTRAIRCRVCLCSEFSSTAAAVRVPCIVPQYGRIPNINISTYDALL